MIKNARKHDNSVSNSFSCRMYCTSGATDDVDLLPLQIRVAVLVTSAPTGLLKEEYFTLLSPQIVELIKFAIDSKDVSLQKICVLAIMRISHFKGDICDLHLVQPLTAALLNIDNENPQLSQRSNDQSVLISNSSAVQRSVSSTESIHSAVNVLHVLLTVCPTQQPLLASLERCGVIKPVLALAVFLLTSNRNSSLLPKVQDICRVIFSTSIHTEYIAKQLHDVIIHTTRNMFCIDTDGHLTVERRMRRISETQTASAADYAHHLGLQSKEDEGVGKVLSPAELLSAKQAQSLKLSASAGITLDERDGGREKGGANGRGDNVRAPGWEVDDILSMALIAASAEERKAASKRASLSLPLPLLPSSTPISNTSQSTYNLWDLGMHDSQEDEDSNIEYGRGDDDESEGVTGPGSAHLMLEVSVRAKAAAELLLHTEQSVSNPQSNSRDNGDTDGKGKCDISKRNGLKVAVAVEGMGEIDEIETKITREGVAAELFICCLQHFLTRPATGPLHGHLQVQVQSNRPTTATATAGALSSHEVNELDRGLSGLVLVLLQAHVPMENLLEGG